jgi:hypothetical protein
VTADVGTLETPRGGTYLTIILSFTHSLTRSLMGCFFLMPLKTIGGFLDFTFRDTSGQVIKLRGTGGQRESRPRFAGASTPIPTTTATTTTLSNETKASGSEGDEKKETNDDSDSDKDDNEEESFGGTGVQIEAPTEFTFQSIGVIDSCFPTKYGTPRQGSVAPLARASLTLRDNVHAMTLDGLHEYSHVWLLFIFHSMSLLFKVPSLFSLY